jgi:Cellulase (glycosyl hydrolase family 5)
MTSIFKAPLAGFLFGLSLFTALTTTHSPAYSAEEARGAISVRDTQLFRDRQPFLVNGVQILAFVAPQSVLQRRPWYLRAYQHFRTSLLQRAQTDWHANTILFKFGEPELDPESGIYSEDYIREVIQAVQLARGMGFTVIASVDELPPSGTSSQSPLPTASTANAVKTLAGLFGDDQGVMIEPYNEPFSPSCSAAILSTRCSGTTADAWGLWRDGALDGTYVGINTLIKAARSSGARNVILVQPLGHGGNFDGFPDGVADPLNKIVYAVHPYFQFSGTSPASWDAHFGNFAATHPAIADEWAANTKGKICSDPPGDIPREFLSYIAQRNIGLVAWALDLPGTIVKDYTGTPNTFAGFKCGDPGGGAGELVMEFFAGTQRAVLR